MTEERTAPMLGAGSIDLSAIHAADARGHDLEKAVEKARVEPERRDRSGSGKRDALRDEAVKLGIDVPEDITSIGIRKLIAEQKAGSKSKAAPAASPASSAAAAAN